MKLTRSLEEGSTPEENRLSAEELVKDLAQNVQNSGSKSTGKGKKDDSEPNHEMPDNGVDESNSGSVSIVPDSIADEEGEWTPVCTRRKSQMKSAIQKGRIWIVWKPDIYEVSVEESGPQHVHCFIRHKHIPVEFFVTVVYGFNDEATRADLWDHLVDIGSSIILPWTVCGDFNAVLNPAEKLGGQESDLNQIQAFRNCLISAHLLDMNYTSCYYTWTNNQDGQDRIFSKLDRVLINDRWMNCWPDVVSTFLHGGVSDHSPAIISWSQNNVKRKPSFMFFNMLSTDPDFIYLIEQSWGIEVQGCAMYRFMRRLKGHHGPLKTLNDSNFRDIDKKEVICRYNLLRAQAELAADPLNDDIGKVFLDYYKNLLNGHAAAWNISQSEIDQGNVLTVSQQLNLIKPVTEEEILMSFMSMNSDKSPGPDGFGAGFYKSAWSVIKDDCIQTVKEFFSSGKLLREVNNTDLVLIPKFDCANSVADYRPIALCNSIYKCISKIMSNRLQSVLPFLICDNQAAFVSGRSIVHNILICQELMRFYGRKNSSPRCFMKVDIKKAYDMISWDFIHSMLQALKFPAKFIIWVMECITSVSFSLVINGQRVGNFKSSRGIRQGDPISPLIFVIAMDMLTRKLKLASSLPRFRFHPLCKDVGLINLAFADDLMLFCKGNVDSVTILKDTFNHFSSSSGLYANPQKSQVFMAGISEDLMQQIQNVTGFSRGSFPFKYLGLPLSARKWSSNTCQVLVEKITKRLASWHTRNLSYQGRMQLINSVLMSLHIYWATVFIIPKSVIKQIERKCRDFLWGLNSVGRPRAAIAWDQLCLGKKYGGLGFQNIQKWNLTAVGKQVWELAMKKDHLWVRWISSVYLKHADFWECDFSNSSWHWKQILKCRDKFRQWYDNGLWLGDSSNSYSVRQGYKLLIGVQETFPYHKLVWNPASIPRHCFILWLAVKDRLRTKDFLAGFIQLNPTCSLCNSALETRNHLFFTCCWSRELLELVCNWCYLDRFHTGFGNWCHWLRHSFSHKKRKQVIYVVMAAVMYHIWTERNKRIFSNVSMRPDQVFVLIKKELALRVALFFPDFKNWLNNTLVQRILIEL
ncbi:hypothetical protein RIF29_16726 [Crotalaria pallida]|uniref:Reverse transcriptase domain-containing protein n=1 Tax=Crotalaria pallida TaxID=3830 RepID=A0AAN9FFQ0_CROPI